MGNYKNFDLVVYFIAGGVANATREKLQKDIDFFKRYMRIDKVYLEPFRDGVFATEEHFACAKKFLNKTVFVLRAVLPHPCRICRGMWGNSACSTRFATMTRI